MNEDLILKYLMDMSETMGEVSTKTDEIRKAMEEHLTKYHRPKDLKDILKLSLMIISAFVGGGGIFAFIRLF